MLPAHLLQTQTFYIWKSDPLWKHRSSIKWQDLHRDTWFLYEPAKNRVTKTMHMTLEEVGADIYKTYPRDKKERTRYDIIPAAPINIGSYPAATRLRFGQSSEVEGMDFNGLMKRDLLYVRSYENADVEKNANLFIDISYKKILDKMDDRTRDRRQLLGDLRRKSLAEYQARFPDLPFNAYIISYYTYDLNPACFRSFEELYDDHQDEQDRYAREALWDLL